MKVLMMKRKFYYFNNSIKINLVHKSLNMKMKKIKFNKIKYLFNSNKNKEELIWKNKKKWKTYKMNKNLK